MSQHNSSKDKLRVPTTLLALIFLSQIIPEEQRRNDSSISWIRSLFPFHSFSNYNNTRLPYFSKRYTISLNLKISLFTYVSVTTEAPSQRGAPQSLWKSLGNFSTEKKKLYVVSSIFTFQRCLILRNSSNTRDKYFSNVRIESKACILNAFGLLITRIL